jgi:hypothetical protein
MNAVKPSPSKAAIQKAALEIEFKKQRRGCGYRGIEFELTFDEWFDIWQKSGHLKDRGVPGYCMVRHGGKGAFKVGNVSIIPTSKAALLSPGAKQSKKG